MPKPLPSERRWMIRFLLAYVAGGTGGTLAAVLVVLLFQWLGWGKTGSFGVAALPWSVCGLILIPAALRKGIELGEQNDQRPDASP